MVGEFFLTFARGTGKSPRPACSVCAVVGVDIMKFATFGLIFLRPFTITIVLSSTTLHGLPDGLLWEGRAFSGRQPLPIAHRATQSSWKT